LSQPPPTAIAVELSKGEIVNLKVVTGGVLAASVMLSACATAPSKITAAYVSPLKFENYDCSQVAVEQASVEQRTNVLYHNLKSRNNSDKWMMGVGLLVAWPALLFMKGNNSAENAEYAQLKGDYEALRQASVAKRCDLAFAGDLATVATQKKAAVAVAPAALPARGSLAPRP
jgi:hypothetical protein